MKKTKALYFVVKLSRALKADGCSDESEALDVAAKIMEEAIDVERLSLSMKRKIIPVSNVASRGRLFEQISSKL